MLNPSESLTYVTAPTPGTESGRLFARMPAAVQRVNAAMSALRLSNQNAMFSSPWSLMR